MPKIDNEKCIEIRFVANTTAPGIIPLKKEFKEYAEELGWKLNTDKEGYIDEEGQRRYEVSFFPKEKKISPEEFRKQKEKIIGFIYSILRNILYPISRGYENEEVIKKIVTTLDLSSDKKKCVFSMGEVLSLQIDTEKLIELEKKHYNLAKTIFDITLKEWKENLESRLKKSSQFWFNRNQGKKAKIQELIRYLEVKGLK